MESVRAAAPRRLSARRLVFKPKLIGNAAVDILNQQIQQPSFPQESTGDQFFDEAQLESFRKLALAFAECVFPRNPHSPYGQAFWKAVLVA